MLSQANSAGKKEGLGTEDQGRKRDWGLRTKGLELRTKEERGTGGLGTDQMPCQASLAVAGLGEH